LSDELIDELVDEVLARALPALQLRAEVVLQQWWQQQRRQLARSAADACRELLAEHIRQVLRQRLG
jgi:predicted kinase